MMIAPEKLRPGTLADAIGFSLLMPVAPTTDAFLIGYGSRNELVGVFLGGDFDLCIQEVKGSAEWAGIFFDDVRIEVDLASAFMSSGFGTVLGSIRISEAGAVLIANASASPEGNSPAQVRFTDERDHPASTNKVFFSSWSIVTGEGREKVTLWQRTPATSE